MSLPLNFGWMSCKQRNENNYYDSATKVTDKNENNCGNNIIIDN